MPLRRRSAALRTRWPRCCCYGLLAVLASMLLTGCGSVGDVTTPPDAAVRETGWSGEQPGEEDKNKKDDKNNKDEKEPKKPKPRTVWQALCLYRQCLRCPQCFQEQNEKGGGSSSHEPPASAGSGSFSREPRASAGSGSNGSGSSGSEEKKEDKTEEPEVAWFSAHAQATLVTQVHDHFHSPYVGRNSLLPEE